ncbi:MAG: hypothetical protein L0338_20945 [Acidobacteria bacterium]|nr:hypothetical protein [Acidobacteriota bacterium]
MPKLKGEIGGNDGLEQGRLSSDARGQLREPAVFISSILCSFSNGIFRCLAASFPAGF